MTSFTLPIIFRFVSKKTAILSVERMAVELFLKVSKGSKDSRDFRVVRDFRGDL